MFEVLVQGVGARLRGVDPEPKAKSEVPAVRPRTMSSKLKYRPPSRLLLAHGIFPAERAISI